MAGMEEQGHDRFRFTEVYRPMFAKMVFHDPDTCLTVIKAFSNASHFNMDIWRCDRDGRPNIADALSMHSRGADALIKVLGFDCYRNGGEFFYLAIAAPKYLCDRALKELEDEIDVENRITLETADFSGQRTIE
ncbi:hypothetical protein PFICI_13544 [Pestalotiopsis fici W106-1]|uniref:Uncharacterized protein n=1 Tax=Pestalotiopsis fici (strain W106-1 / CGMCC3.15140) TaxID=1229662 RepID=W3WMB1_PESFW|nr:uncharacterized protein PFICI_13544 [Pestalotiopsis fici W106-1]ETS75060.1 hypothetical protein PFICI_13544 [Pestalotiopsis fici W106-1]